MARSRDDPHAVIVGTSVAGLASACALAQSGWRVTVLERRPDLSEGGQAFLPQPNGLTALERLGALDLVCERGVEIGKVQVHESGRLLWATYDYRELRHPLARDVGAHRAPPPRDRGASRGGHRCRPRPFRAHPEPSRAARGDLLAPRRGALGVASG